MNTYNHNKDSKISYIPIYEIGISTPIINAVKQISNAKFDNYVIDNSAPQFGKLARLDSFVDFQNCIYPPVVLKFIDHQNIFSIIDGRHRIAMSIANNKTHVPAYMYNITLSNLPEFK